MSIVRVSVRLQSSPDPEDVSHCVFDMDLLGAPVPQQGTLLRLGAYVVMVKGIEYNPSQVPEEAPEIRLMTGLTRTRRDPVVTPEDLAQTLKVFPSIVLVST